MVGNRIGGRKAAKTNKERYGEDFFRNLGRLGGTKGRGAGYTGGFASPTIGADGMTGAERARVCGAIGGRKSRRNREKDDIDKAAEILEQENGGD